MSHHQTVSFFLNGLLFEYDEEKNRANIKKHGISFRTAARVFFDYDRIEFYDEQNSFDEDRFDVIGDTSAGIPESGLAATVGDPTLLTDGVNDVLYVVYTERSMVEYNGSEQSVTRIISARQATNFERGLYYGKQG